MSYGADLPIPGKKASNNSSQGKTFRVRPILEAGEIGDKVQEMTPEAEEGDFKVLEPVVWLSVIATFILYGLILCDLYISVSN
jgi:hypothetical protein